MHKVWLTDMRHPEVAALLERPHVGVVPIGSTEQHGPHLPLDVDMRITSAMCEAAAVAIADEVGVAIAPPLQVGVSEHHMRFPGTVSLDASTFTELLVQVGTSLVRHGFEHLAIVNGHAGNVGAMQVAAARLRLDAGASRVVSVSEWTLARDAFAAVRESGPGGCAHACEYETSVYLHLDRDAVAVGDAVAEMPPPDITGGAIDLFAGGPYAVALGRDFSQSGVLGDPTLATAEKGRVAFDAAVANLVRLLRELAAP
jgi:creatinine amidohydrolase